MLDLSLRRQVLAEDERGRAVWRVEEERQRWEAAQTALLLCDVWDLHWCRGANQRLAALLPRMEQTVQAARGMGVQIIHAPSDTMEFYEGSAARRRALEAPQVEPPEDRQHADPPLPVDASDEGCDTAGDTPHKAWCRQHEAIGIDEGRDIVSDDGRQVYSYFRHKGIDRMLIMGVHTNMCVLHRSFAIKQMVRWGVEVALLRDLTDAMYNPAMPPYVSHDEGTRLVVEFIEKFWCPTVDSGELVGG